MLLLSETCRGATSVPCNVRVLTKLMNVITLIDAKGKTATYNLLGLLTHFRVLREVQATGRGDDKLLLPNLTL